MKSKLRVWPGTFPNSTWASARVLALVKIVDARDCVVLIRATMRIMRRLSDHISCTPQTLFEPKRWRPQFPASPHVRWAWF
jgi:hypothetical protein